MTIKYNLLLRIIVYIFLKKNLICVNFISFLKIIQNYLRYMLSHQNINFVYLLF